MVILYHSHFPQPPPSSTTMLNQHSLSLIISVLIQHLFFIVLFIILLHFLPTHHHPFASSASSSFFSSMPSAALSVNHPLPITRCLKVTSQTMDMTHWHRPNNQLPYSPCHPSQSLTSEVQYDAESSQFLNLTQTKNQHHHHHFQVMTSYLSHTSLSCYLLLARTSNHKWYTQAWKPPTQVSTISQKSTSTTLTLKILNIELCLTTCSKSEVLFDNHVSQTHLLYVMICFKCVSKQPH